MKALNDAIENIGRVLFDTTAFDVYKHDFHTVSEGEYTVIHAVSEKSRDWCYDNLPEQLDRVGATGFRVETKWIDIITDSMRHDGLVDGDAEEELTREQWWAQEDQDEQYIADVTGADMEIRDGT